MRPINIHCTCSFIQFCQASFGLEVSELVVVTYLSNDEHHIFCPWIDCAR